MGDCARREEMRRGRELSLGVVEKTDDDDFSRHKRFGRGVCSGDSILYNADDVGEIGCEGKDVH